MNSYRAIEDPFYYDEEMIEAGLGCFKRDVKEKYPYLEILNTKDTIITINLN